MEIVIGIVVFVGAYWAGNRYLAYRAARRQMKHRLSTLVTRNYGPLAGAARNRLGED